MEDKTFELIEKLYSRMEEGFKSVNDRADGIESKMEKGFNEVNQNMARMEDKFNTKISALFDGLTANTEAINNLRTDMQTLETKVDAHEVKLKIVK